MNEVCEWKMNEVFTRSADLQTVQQRTSQIQFILLLRSWDLELLSRILCEMIQFARKHLWSESISSPCLILCVESSFESYRVRILCRVWQMCDKNVSEIMCDRIILRNQKSIVWPDFQNVWQEIKTFEKSWMTEIFKIFKI